MAVVTVTQHGKSFSLDKDGSHPLRDASFSSYLNSSAGEAFIISTAMAASGDSPCRSRIKYGRDGEIDVFAAEKYFSGEMDREMEKAARRGEKFLESNPYGDRKSAGDLQRQPEAPGVFLDAGRNSGASHRQKQANADKAFLFRIGCNCARKKSVDIAGDDEKSAESTNEKGRTSNAARTNGGKITGNRRNSDLEQLESGAREDDTGRDKQRVSSEAFGPPFYMAAKEEDGIPSEFHGKQWGTADDDEDNGFGSDASSDLFEIQSFSSKAPRSFFHPRSTDDESSCYEPSEKSIEWSVVTASAATNFSATTDREARRPAERMAGRKASAGPRRLHSSLLGCGNGKALTVAESATEKAESEPGRRRPGRHLQPDLMVQSARFHAEHRGLMELDPALQQAHSMQTLQLPN